MRGLEKKLSGGVGKGLRERNNKKREKQGFNQESKRMAK